MAEGQVLIKDLPETLTVDDSSYIPVDNGTLTQKISVENFNDSSNQTAKGYAEQAQAAATTATEAIADVNSKVDAAQAQANIATTQAGYAQTYAGNAQTYSGNAQGYANTAQGSATNAAASASAASSSADAANDNATLARSWAEGNTGAREGENTNNARYWANKAESAAQVTIDPTLDPSSTNPVENRAIYEAINTIHTGGSNITITTTETSLRGKDCVLTDGTISYTKQFDLTGKALFEGVQLTGDITITSTDGTQTATDTLNVPYFGNFSKEIAFWRATIAVTTNTTQFNGLNVVAKKNGAVMGTGTFSNGSASLTVPSAGTYVLEVTLDWKTYTSSPFSVTEETTYNETIDGYIAPISLTTPTSEFYGQSISVTRNGVALPVSLAFDNTGAASFTALDEGTYLFTLTYGGEPYTATVTVEAATTYSAVIKMWTATVNISTTSSVLQLQQIVVKKSGVQVGTTQFNAAGTASYIAHEAGTYTFECTYDSYPFSSDPVAVSDETTYSTTITAFTATLNITTPSAELYSRPITIKKGSATVGTTAFSSSGSATYRVHETGIYTLTCDGYDASVTVIAETTYPVSILAGLDLASWISAGSTTEHPLNSSSYADFAALEADEEAIRQLMTVHASVDYLAQATAGDSLMEDVINSDVCAKWINLRDYALDTLYANSDIADVMDTAGKYGYGDWVEEGQVPVLSADTTAVIKSTELSSTYSAWKAFDGSSSTGWVPSYSANNNYVGYEFDTPIKLARVHIELEYSPNNVTIPERTYKIQYYDGEWKDFKSFVIEPISTRQTIIKDINIFSAIKYSKIRLFCADAMVSSGAYTINVTTLQFYAYEPKGNVPIMTADNAPYGTAIASSYDTNNQAFKAFDDSATFTYWQPTTVSGAYIGYKFTAPICPRRVKYNVTDQSAGASYVKSVECIVKGTNDGGTTWEEIDRFTTVAGSITPEYYDIECNKFYESVAVFPQGANYDNGIVIASLQFYGRELKPLAPVMSGDNTPKGEVVYSSQYNNTDYAGYKAFGAESQTKAWLPTASDANPYIGYKGNAPFNIKMFGGRGVSPATNRNTITWKIYGSDTGDANDWHDLNQTFVFCPYITSKQFEELTMNGSYKCYKLEHVSHTTDGLTVGSGNMFYFYGYDYSEKEFAPNSGMKYIYDHGVELEELEELSTANGWSNGTYTFTSPVLKDYMMDISPNGGSGVISGIGSKNILALGSYNRAYMKADTVKFEGTTTAFRVLSASKTNFNTSNIAIDSSIPSTPEVSLDIQAVNDAYLSVYSPNSSSRRMYVYEIWLE